jgi:hypothetical protein
LIQSGRNVLSVSVSISTRSPYCVSLESVSAESKKRKNSKNDYNHADDVEDVHSVPPAQLAESGGEAARRKWEPPD